jgi:hypothetical protein
MGHITWLPLKIIYYFLSIIMWLAIGVIFFAFMVIDQMPCLGIAPGTTGC